MKYSLKSAILAICAASAAMPVMAMVNDSQNLAVEHLGVNNTLLRVNPDAGNYIMLPVQESNDDATINILVDGRLDRTIYARLAKSKVDYTVPFDLTPYKGHNVVFNIVTSQNRSGLRDVQDDTCWQNFTLTDTLDNANREKYRPAYHHTPQWGWMNDPNGMFFKDGLWHLYYQWNPYGSKWQNMTWGHSSSSDLIHWNHHPAAIEPNGLGTVFSGSSAIDHNNTAGFGRDAVVSLYTSAGASQIQSLASSTDNGMTFDIYPGNPVLTLDSEARDPNFFYDSESGLWHLVLAHALDHEMLFFTSPDMKQWTLTGNFGKGLGAQGGVWECPDLFKLPVEGENAEKWVLICNLNPGGPFGGSGVQYFVGDFDGKTFHADTDASGQVATKWLDYGKDNYALVSWSDAPQGRRVGIGWMSNWQYAAEVPTQQFRSANTLPREISLFRAADGQVYAASNPSPEVNAIRGSLVSSAKRTSLSRKAKTFRLPTSNDGICEILADIEPGKSNKVTLTLANEAGEKSVLIYNRKNSTLSFDRTASGLTQFSNDFPAVTIAPTFNEGRTLSLRIFIDRSSIEVFGNDGRSVMTNLVFPTTPYSTLAISSEGKDAKVKNLRIFELKDE